MTLPSCSLWMFVARTDVSFMMHTIPHLIKMCNFPFEETVLCIDTKPLTGDKVLRPHIGTMEQLRQNCEELLKRGIVDRVIDIDYNPVLIDKIHQKHFNAKIKQTHNYKGYPVYGSIFKIEMCKSDYVLHFDSDMMLHQPPNYNWIEEGIQIIEKHAELISTRPFAGPPREDRTPPQEISAYKGDGEYYRFKGFGSRAYLINRKRFDQLVPFPIIWKPYRKKIMNQIPNSAKTVLNAWLNKGKLESWEVLLSEKLKQTQYYRGMLSNPTAWTLHPNCRTPEFFQALPTIINRIEEGNYPPGQGGTYDLKLDLWI
ncbi:MAG: hypothetical protein ACO3EZ_15895 [Prochlorotrichaceae cyanobacterium]